MIHCRQNQKEDAKTIKGNNQVDTTAKRVVLEPVTWQLPLIKPNPSNYSLNYTKKKKLQKKSRSLWVAMNRGNNSFPKLQLLKTSGRLIKVLTKGQKPYTNG